jgi:hypothetical protein
MSKDEPIMRYVHAMVKAADAEDTKDFKRAIDYYHFAFVEAMGMAREATDAIRTCVIRGWPTEQEVKS